MNVTWNFLVRVLNRRHHKLITCNNAGYAIMWHNEFRLTESLMRFGPSSAKMKSCRLKVLCWNCCKRIGYCSFIRYRAVDLQQFLNITGSSYEIITSVCIHPITFKWITVGGCGGGHTLKDESIDLDLNNSTTRTERSNCISTSIIQNLNDCMGKI